MSTLVVSKHKIRLNKVKTFFQKPQNTILVIFGIFLSIATFVPIFILLLDTIKVHPGSIDAYFTGRATGLTLYNWKTLFTDDLAKTNFWGPLANSLILSVFSCAGAILFGGIVAYLITRTNLKFKRFISTIFIFPYIMPQWTLAVIWQNLFKSKAVTGGSDGLFAYLFNINMPLWWAQGLFPSIIILSIHYAPFAYLLIGAIFRNMDSNLEEAAVILNTPKRKSLPKLLYQ